MFRSIMRILTVLMVLMFLCGQVAAETWRVGKSTGWKRASSSRQEAYRLAVAEIKTLVNKGKAKDVRGALEKLKTDFPEIAGEDLDAFIEAEILFSKGKYVKTCRAYENFLEKYPESGLYDVVLEREFSVGLAFLSGHKRSVLKVFKMRGYAEGAKIMQRIDDRVGDTPMAAKTVIAVAKSYEKRKKYEDAYLKWSEVSTRWPMGEVGKEALLSMARCKHLGYKGANYDSSNLVSAKSYYEKFKLKYPADAAKIRVDATLKIIYEQMAAKQLKIGLYYQKMGNDKSANFYFKMLITRWGDSESAKLAKMAMVKSEPGKKKVKTK